MLGSEIDNRQSALRAADTDGCKVSVVTVVRNARCTIGDAVVSVLEQTESGLDYVVVDGMSDDGTNEILMGFNDPRMRVRRGSDNGIYDALNKGIEFSRGGVIGFLHSDDMLTDSECLSRVCSEFEDPSVDAVYADLVYVEASCATKVVRYWEERRFDRKRFLLGWMPPHPTVYVRRTIYEQYGGFRNDFRSSADYEMMIRLFYKHCLNVRYVPKILVRMRVGGQSNASWSNRRLANWEDRQAWIVNGLKPPPFLRLTKPLRKLPQYWRRPPVSLGPD
ncbi:MAG: glycosyltransferase family 2 protein [Planctomycetota bacterium]